MSTTSDTFQLTISQRSKSDQLCSLCSSPGQFGCLEHCQGVFCAECTGKHRVIIIERMRDLVERLKRYQLNSSILLDGSQVTSPPELSADKETNSKISPETNNSLLVYLNLLEQLIGNGRLVNEKTLVDVNRVLADSTGLIKKNVPSVTSSVNFDTHKLLTTRSRMRVRTAKVTYSKRTTISLDVQKLFTLPIQRSFSLGQHPIVVSLIDHYLETPFFQWRDNSVILLSLLSIDIYARGSGLTWSIPMTRVLGNRKDKIIGGVWCSYIERLILVGRYHFYVFDIDQQKVRCLCECGCGGRCGSGVMRPKTSRNTTLMFRCETSSEDYGHSPRFLVSSYDGHLFYAYKSGTDTYRLEVFHSSLLSDFIDRKHNKCWSAHETYPKLIDREIEPTRILSIDGQLAAMCVTHDHLACIYRRFRRTNKQVTKFQNPSFEIDHYFLLLDHSLARLTDSVLLSSSIRWVTGIVSCPMELEYLICDPRGQQLLLYQAIDNTLIRRFHIGPVNACSLTDGRLALWIQKSYANAPIGRLHFISPPHLENYAAVATSSELLKRSHN